MTKGFTLIEVLISLSIMFTVGLGLLQVSSNSAKLIERAKLKNEANSRFSLPLLNGFCKDSDSNLYDAVKDKFAINDDKVSDALKNINFTCENEELLNINLADNTELNNTLDEIPNLSFTINKIYSNLNGANTIFYEIKAQM